MMFENLNSNTLFGKFIILHLSLYKYISVNLLLPYFYVYVYTFTLYIYTYTHQYIKQNTFFMYTDKYKYSCIGNFFLKCSNMRIVQRGLIWIFLSVKLLLRFYTQPSIFNTLYND